ncbi:MAG: hypothetical protein KGS45_02910 [Planctomycetes bacterium]|nr:hypothetical protein [Planctomycetota bacterium]
MHTLHLFKPYSEHEYQRREVLCVILMALGLIWLVTVGLTGWHVGIITSMASVGAGAAFGSYMSRHTERGIWMLALLFGSCAAFFYLFAIAMEIRGHLQRRTPPPWWLAMDAAIACMIVRASWTVVRQNRQLK